MFFFFMILILIFFFLYFYLPSYLEQNETKFRWGEAGGKVALHFLNKLHPCFGS